MEQSILIVDDEADLVGLYKIVLKMAGFQVTGTTSGRQALQQVQDQTPDLILLDVMMPEISGIEVCKTIRSLALDKQPIVFMYSANDSYENKDRCLNAGADRLISKSVPVDAVTEEIRLVLPVGG